MQVRNGQDTAQQAWLFEYEDPEAYKRCQKIFKTIEAELGDLDIQLTAFRGAVLEDFDWK